MRVKEWYGWHFPELAKVIPDNLMYCRVVKKMGMRTNAATTDFSDIVPEELAAELKEVVQVSMGTEVGALLPFFSYPFISFISFISFSLYFLNMSLIPYLAFGTDQ
jgi:hypothetical protein